MPYTPTVYVPGSAPGISATNLNKHEQATADASVRLEDLEVKVSNLQNRMNLMEATLPENFLYNRFDSDFTSITSIKLIRGRYNQAQSRLEV